MRLVCDCEPFNLRLTRSSFLEESKKTAVAADFCAAWKESKSEGGSEVIVSQEITMKSDFN